MSDLFKRVKSGCLFHEGINWDCIPCLEFALACLCDAINQINEKWEERQNEIFEENHAAFRAEAAIVQHNVEQSKLSTKRAIELGIIRGPEVEEDRSLDFGIYGVQEGGVVSPSDDSDRSVVEREDSVGRRRRRQEFDSLGILPEERSGE